MDILQLKTGALYSSVEVLRHQILQLIRKVCNNQATAENASEDFVAYQTSTLSKYAKEVLIPMEVAEDVRARLQEEGREARNLVAYSLPIQESPSYTIDYIPRPKDSSKSNTLCKSLKQHKRPRSASAGRDPQASLRARHWGFLFRNLQQAVDEIYQTCEVDESVIECKNIFGEKRLTPQDVRRVLKFDKSELNKSKADGLNNDINDVGILKPIIFIQKSEDQIEEITSALSSYDNENLSLRKVDDCNSSETSVLNDIQNEKKGLSVIIEKSAVSENTTNIKSENLFSTNYKENSLSDSSSVKCNEVQNENDQPCISDYSASNNLNKEESKDKDVNIEGGTNDNSCQAKLDDNAINVPCESLSFVEEKNKQNLVNLNTEEKSSEKKYQKCSSIKETGSKKDIASVDKLGITDKRTNKVCERKYSEEVKKSMGDFRHLSSARNIPTVNMNKASQVRQAYNQNKTPKKLSSQVMGSSVSYACSKQLGTKSLNNNTQSSICNRTSMQKSSYRWVSSYSHNRNMVSGRKNSNQNYTSGGFLRSYTSLEMGTTVSYQNKSPSSSSLTSAYSSSEQSCRDKDLKGSVDSGQSVDSAVQGHKGISSKGRFHLPSSAMSLPSLALQNECNEASKETHRKLAKPSSFNGDLKACKSAKKNNTVDSSASSSHHSTSFGHSVSTTHQGDIERTTYKNVRNSNNCEESSYCDDKAVSKQISNVKLSNDLQNDNIVKSVKNDNMLKRLSESKFATINEDCKHLCSENHQGVLPKNFKCKGEVDVIQAEDINCQQSVFVELSLEEESANHGENISGNNEAENEDNAMNAECSVLLSDKRAYESDSGMEDEEEMRHYEEAIECAAKEEERLKQQIEETENTNIEVSEMEEEDEEEEKGGESKKEVVSEKSSSTSNYNDILSSLSWAEQVEAEESLRELREPGHALYIHEKLSSPSRKLSLSEKLKKHQEKLAKAQALREKLIHAKTEKLKELFKRIDEVNEEKERLLGEKRILFQRKMQRAEEKRKQYLQEIVNKAHDEENKAKEIAFINGLEAQNKLHELMQQQQIHESRMADMAEERSRKVEEKAAKGAAAQERRKAMEMERQARMAELCERRRQKCERIDRQQAERREELLEQAREKARDREERLTALQQAQQAKESELVIKIQQKLEETTRRHEENIEQIRRRALESSILRYSKGCDDAPKPARYETKKLCTLCNALIASEVYLLSHLLGKFHQEALKELMKDEGTSMEDSATYNLKHIVDAPSNINDPQVTKDKERQKALKKRCRKIRTRMISRGKEYDGCFSSHIKIKDSSNRNRINKAVQAIVRVVSSQGTGPWATSDVALLDKALLELIRILKKDNKNDSGVYSDQLILSSLKGFEKIELVLAFILSTPEKLTCVVPAKSLGFCGQVVHAASCGCDENCRHLLYSNFIGNLIDYLLRRFGELVIETNRAGSCNSINTILILPSDPAISSMLETLAEVLSNLCESDLKNLNVNDNKTKEMAESTWQRVQHVVSYCVSVGLLDKISWYFSHVQGPVEGDIEVMNIILASLQFLSALTKTLMMKCNDDFGAPFALTLAQPWVELLSNVVTPTSGPLQDDLTQLIGTFHVTDACGVVSLLYGLLLHQGGTKYTSTSSSPSQSCSTPPPSPPQLPASTKAITLAGTTFLHNLAQLNLNTFQVILGSEGISLELRHIASYLIWHSSYWPCDDILHNVIALVGYFTVNNKENQMIMQSGEVPSVLQQLSALPWPYFSDPHLSDILFPTLLSCCLNNNNNMYIIQQEMSFEVLKDYLMQNKNSDKHLMPLLYKIYMENEGS